MITTYAKYHRKIKRRTAIREEERASERKSKPESEEMDDRNTNVECGAEKDPRHGPREKRI